MIPFLFFWLVSLFASVYLLGQEKAKLLRQQYNQIIASTTDAENPEGRRVVTPPKELDGRSMPPANPSE